MSKDRVKTDAQQILNEATENVSARRHQRPSRQRPELSPDAKKIVDALQVENDTADILKTVGVKPTKTGPKGDEVLATVRADYPPVIDGESRETPPERRAITDGKKP